MLKLKRILDAVIFLSIALVIGSSIMAGFSSSLPPYQPNQQGMQQAATEHAAKHNEGEWRKFWRKTADDPVAYFTFWLVILTAVLGLGADRKSVV
jgi:ABC-type antimicrobial peptide transport system permease subunit